MRFLVTGGRDFNDPELVRQALERMPEDATMVHGAARGADTLCADYWASLGRKTEPHPADWKTHGKAAGPIRNQEMLNSGIDLLIAFPGGKGTADMMRRARHAAVPVSDVEDDMLYLPLGSFKP